MPTFMGCVPLLGGAVRQSIGAVDELASDLPLTGKNEFQFSLLFRVWRL
jgi:hypothetical protein